MGPLVAASAQDAKPPNPLETPSPKGARVYFIGLKDGKTVKSPVTIRFGLKGMGVCPAGTYLPDTGHHHLLINMDVKELDAKKKQTEQVGGKLDDLQELIEEKRAAIKGVEGQLKKIRLERQKVEEDIQRDQETAEVTRQKIETQFRQPADQVVKQMKEEAAKAQAAQRVRLPGLRPQGGRHR